MNCQIALTWDGVWHGGLGAALTVDSAIIIAIGEGPGLGRVGVGGGGRGHSVGVFLGAQTRRLLLLPPQVHGLSPGTVHVLGQLGQLLLTLHDVCLGTWSFKY